MLLRRFPIDLLTDEEVELACVGVVLHLGSRWRRTRPGDLLIHIRETAPKERPTLRLYARANVRTSH